MSHHYGEGADHPTTVATLRSVVEKQIDELERYKVALEAIGALASTDTSTVAGEIFNIVSHTLFPVQPPTSMRNQGGRG